MSLLIQGVGIGTLTVLLMCVCFCMCVCRVEMGAGAGEAAGAGGGEYFGLNVWQRAFAFCLPYMTVNCVFSSSHCLLCI